MKIFRTLNCENITLRFHENTDFKKLLKVFNDKKTMQHIVEYLNAANGYATSEAWTEEMVKSRFNKFHSKQEQGICIAYCIESKGEVVGECGFSTIDWTAKKATWGIITHYSVWGTGLSQTCMSLCLDYAFEELGLEAVCFQNNDSNTASKRFLEKMQIPFLRMDDDGERYYEISKKGWANLSNIVGRRP